MAIPLAVDMTAACCSGLANAQPPPATAPINPSPITMPPDDEELFLRR
jgi:hypothetical protein